MLAFLNDTIFDSVIVAICTKIKAKSDYRAQKKYKYQYLQKQQCLRFAEALFIEQKSY
jgi:hypothetical protein